MVNLKINGIPVQVEERTTILNAAKKVNIKIPTLCNSPDYPSWSSCGICVVRIGDEMVKACTTVVGANLAGKDIITHDAGIIATRRMILENILSNHPNDCLQCLRNRNCELQSLAADFGIRESYFRKVMRGVPVDSSNQFFVIDRNKCIFCGRCEIACNTLQCVGVGPMFGTKEPDCVSCGNCVSRCPTGALSPKKGASYADAKKVLTTCSYCGVGCQMYLMVRENKIIGVEPANGKSNKGMLCVKGKFAYDFVGHKDRLTQPLIKKDGKFVEVDWEEAYSLIAKKITETKQKHGADAIAGFSSARVTNEENYAFQKFMRAAVGTNNVDHCARL